MSNSSGHNGRFQNHFDKYWGETASGLSSVLTVIADKATEQDFNSAV
ncbi:hypothetical protein [uncultured Endozoicomonas sp.]|nr:hypothetical protein [uncultured Endozoicomonas sp.]